MGDLGDPNLMGHLTDASNDGKLFCTHVAYGIIVIGILSNSVLVSVFPAAGFSSSLPEEKPDRKPSIIKQEVVTESDVKTCFGFDVSCLF